MDELKKSTLGAADIGSEAHTGIPQAGNVTPGTTPNAADLTENELEDVVGGGGLFGNLGGADTVVGISGSLKSGHGTLNVTTVTGTGRSS